MALFIVVIRGLVAMALVAGMYVALDLYMRWDRRKTLEEEHAAGAAPGLTREDYIARGLAAYERSWQRKALYAIFLLPVVIGIILVTIAYIT